MDTPLRDQVVFHLTGRSLAAAVDGDAVRGMRPALLAPYRDLTRLRYDFPVVLATRGDSCVESLTAVVDAALRKVAAPGVAGEGLRRRVLKLERGIRQRLAEGAHGTLRQVWDEVASSLAAGDETFVGVVSRAREALDVDGELADCDSELPARFLRHAWNAVQREKAERAVERVRSLMIRLSDILRADFLRSSAALEVPALQSTFGPVHQTLFDFSVMSSLLARAGRHGGLGERRRSRIEDALQCLREQRFFALPASGAAPSPTGHVHEFVFATTDDALSAFRQRLPETVRLLKALQVAELEVEGAYVEGMHDAIVDAIGTRDPSPEDLAFFPDYLVCLGAGAVRSDAAVRLTEALSSGIPLKVLAHVSDLVEDPPLGHGRLAFGLRGSQLAAAATSLDDTFVLQTAASNLLQLRDRVLRGLRHPGPALFSVYVPVADGCGHVPPYLVSAAAKQSRAFPSFSYDPSAGADLASRFSLENNPQPEQDWPVESLAYADPDLQSVTEPVAFTFVDFALCDPRCASHYAPVARAGWSDGMVPAQQWIAEPPPEAGTQVPYVLAVDDADLLCRLVIDERLVRLARRCRDGWHRLQELGGVHDSRAQRLLERERQAWEEQHRQEVAVAPASVPEPVQAGEPAAAPAAAPAVEAPRDPDVAYIETLRCSTCNECTQLNPRMFAYNENQQAYIKDAKAGTYRQLVEAAESCQVSVIHPGKPWDPTEPGLEELLERARPFL